MPVVSREVTVGAEENVKVVEVNIIQDGILEGLENFRAFLSVQPGAEGVEIGNQYQAFASIIDRDGQLYFVHPPLLFAVMA